MFSYITLYIYIVVLYIYSYTIYISNLCVYIQVVIQAFEPAETRFCVRWLGDCGTEFQKFNTSISRTLCGVG